MAKPQGPNADSRERTMRRLIEAGAEESFASASADPFQGLSMAAVAARANVSRNALLYYWKTKDEYTESLASYLLELNELFEQVDQGLKAAVEEAQQKEEPWDAIRTVAEADLSWLEIPEWPSVELLTLFASKNERLRHISTKGFRDIDEETWTNYYEPIARRFGRVPRPPLSGTHIGALLQALLEGAGIRRLVDPTAFSSPDGSSSFDLFSFGIAAILTLCTTDGTDSRTVEEAIRDTFSA